MLRHSSRLHSRRHLRHRSLVPCFRSHLHQEHSLLRQQELTNCPFNVRKYVLWAEANLNAIIVG